MKEIHTFSVKYRNNRRELPIFPAENRIQEATMLRRAFCILIALLLALGSAHAMSRDEMRALWQELSLSRSNASPYAEEPDPVSFRAGALTQAAQADALGCLNFLRAVAGLSPVTLNPLYTLRAQSGAMLLAANDVLTHAPEQPEGMDDALYTTARAGAAQGNIAKFNWMRPEILIDGVTYFARDDGDANLPTLGHRRWLLNPRMAETGFGLANAESGMSYVTMYAVDDSNADAQWSSVAWPAAGVFPVEMMLRDLAWSVSLNDDLYDPEASAPRVVLREETTGVAFSFDALRGEGDGFCAFSREKCGSGSCIIFRPNLETAGINEYVQNQVWTVEITGLRLRDGSAAEISYCCEMISLYPQDVANVELSVLEAALAPGGQLQLSAAVIPEYADDLTLVWTSSDEAVAGVDEDGLVTAHAPGSCIITASSANGRSDACRIAVQ